MEKAYNFSSTVYDVVGVTCVYGVTGASLCVSAAYLIPLGSLSKYATGIPLKQPQPDVIVCTDASAYGCGPHLLPVRLRQRPLGSRRHKSPNRPLCGDSYHQARST
ncbi:hypothetical protein CHS0354_023247 [Potamilus streckersoni]|uniref:Uncharacterized protein n=1 Tax=Potamilus streckersoni TaxID=2493646 RepID=A0AAE0TBA1_9BIVA|nr:hypothetical protein CHS0354_023247 [Potamilus streckersoni]